MIIFVWIIHHQQRQSHSLETAVLRDIIEGTKRDIETEVASWDRTANCQPAEAKCQALIGGCQSVPDRGVYCTVSIKLNTQDNTFTQLVGFLATDSDLHIDYSSYPCYTLGFAIQSAKLRRWVERKSDIIACTQRDPVLRDKLLDTWWQHVFTALPGDQRFSPDAFNMLLKPQHCQLRNRQHYVEYSDVGGNFCVIHKNLITFGNKRINTACLLWQSLDLMTPCP